jgi:hypothetical protein
MVQREEFRRVIQGSGRESWSGGASSLEITALLKLMCQSDARTLHQSAARLRMSSWDLRALNFLDTS